MPDVVSYGGLTIYYSVGGYPIGPSLHTIYQVYSDPQAPMTIPWIEVLNNACYWASGYSTAADVARYCETGLYFAQRFYYPGDYNSHWVAAVRYPPDGSIYEFCLTDYYNTTGAIPGNCVDVSDFLCICENALGLGFQVGMYQNNQTGDTTTNPICLIGSDPTNDGAYKTLPGTAPFIYPWSMHQFCLSGTGTVYDVCAAQKYDLAGNQFRNPPFNWPLNGFWQTTPGLGLFALPANSAPVLFDGPYSPSVL